METLGHAARVSVNLSLSAWTGQNVLDHGSSTPEITFMFNFQESPILPPD